MKKFNITVLNVFAILGVILFLVLFVCAAFIANNNPNFSSLILPIVQIILDEIVPEKASTPLQDVAIYELDENTGTISKLKESFGLPSNENYLNDELGESNVLFSELLEIEDLCQ